MHGYNAARNAKFTLFEIEITRFFRSCPRSHSLAMDSDDFYGAEHFYNEESGASDDESVAGDETEDLSKLGYFELAKRFLGKKELPKIQAENSGDFPPVEKNLYVQVAAITNLQEHEVAAIRQANGPIRVRGKHAPRPIQTFAQAGLPEALTRYLARKDIVKPFPIQMQAIPALLCGRDLVAIAQTGQGKTLAFLLPLLKHVTAQEPLRRGDGPVALVICPTRELALQIYKQLVPLAELLHVRSVCAYGGAPLQDQLNRLKAQCEVLVATPGRLIDVLTASKGKVTNLQRTSFVVLDEADRMFDMGFEPQIAQVLAALNPKRQLSMFSATFPPHVETLARQHLSKPLEISVGDGGAGVVGANIHQNVQVLRSDTDRLPKTLQLLGEWADHGSVIVFAQTKDEVDSLFQNLLKYGYVALTLHGGQDQTDRDSTVEDFKRRKPPNILVATSVAARGLDVKHCVLVINYRVPEHLEDYIHRVGRTGRAGQPGFAHTFICPDEADKADGLVEALKSSSQPVPSALLDLAQMHQAQISLGVAKKKSKWSGFTSGQGFKFDSSEKSRVQKDRDTERFKNVLGDDDAMVEPPVLSKPVAPVPVAPAGPKAPPPPSGPPPPQPPAQFKAGTLPPSFSAKPPPPRAPVNKAPPPPPPKAASSALVPLAPKQASHGELVLATAGGQQVSAATQYFLTKMGGVVPVPAAPQGQLAEEFELNEYPEMARAKGVTRDFRMQLEDRYNVKIQLKGQYIAPGQPVPPGARKLFVEISGSVRANLVRAKKEIFDNVEEVAIKTLNIPEERLKPRKKRFKPNPV